jgi:hypothetical protein
MSITTGEQVYTPDDLLRMPDGERFELVHGRLRERDMGTKAVGLASRIFGLIWTFLLDHPLGHLLMSEAGYACFPDDPNHTRRPDTSFIRFGGLPGEDVLPGFSCPVAEFFRIPTPQK